MKYIFLLFSVLYLSTSCHTVRHTLSTEIHIDSSSTKEADSLREVIKATTRHYESLIKDIQSGVVTFDTLYIPGDTVVNTVTIKADGSIEASGRIKAAYVQTDKLKKTINDLQSKYDSLQQVKNKVQTNVVTNTVTKEKEVKKTFIPWWIWLIVGGLAIWKFYPQIKKFIV